MCSIACGSFRAECNWVVMGSNEHWSSTEKHQI